MTRGAARRASAAPPAQVIDPDLLRTIPLPEYRQDADKADRGKLLVVAGSRRLPGAALLAARAALRTGCGTVRVAAPQSVATALGVALPELMVIPLAETPAGTIALEALRTLEAQYEPCSAAIVGPGLDAHEETDEMARRFVRDAPFPLVVDAQALLAVAQSSGSRHAGDETASAGNVKHGGAAGDQGKALRGTPHALRVYTPHAAEMGTLAGDDVPEEGKRETAREALARRWAGEWGAVLVLKGRETLIAGPDGTLFRNTAGTRGLGTAGSGDTLSGIIGSFLAQGLDPARAATWGVYLHALAGAATAEELGEDGLLASDWVERLPRVLRTLRLRTLA